MAITHQVIEDKTGKANQSTVTYNTHNEEHSCFNL
jgi:hypothetical protein